ncbi:hypothetical protein TMatcc_000041 [Talaromyces marneffei ATCC 18224]|uniref:Uncharacterized protein n=1 Tax=Talaromyces marneffei (strain ATCC 18224 / CBS 334.59 / QM 7333) TaxID=441960 RepID=B6QPU8_TALMQ|nr:uncharacterized protein EYB26_005135 [Talaromyces marneffei]EEA20066.1 hypothetical protein PMAA_039330 [Talaromyces marneffei ATCC 18224]KAE8549085.1 hypothetical protein EYB25_007600 [Talaromyces marneffei]QGA17464.1 hypothetical protein EYB26_005135 [Talaromyces marneffei]
MAPLTSTNSESGVSGLSTEPGLKFCPWSDPLEEHTILVQSNEVHLIPLGDQKCHHKLEVTAQDTLNGFSTAGNRLTDDVIIFSSRSGVVFGRIPNSLSDDAVIQWLKSFLEYVSTSEQAAWWHTDHSGPWACYVFVPMNTKRTKWTYSNTRNDKERPLRILSMLDIYAEEKPWFVWPCEDSRVAIINGKCYVPRQHKRRRNIQTHKVEGQSKESNSTRVSFVWDPVEQSREVILRDEEWKDELLMERVEMSLI